VESEVVQKACDYFTDHGKEYLLLEYPAGKTLSETMPEGGLPVDAAVAMAIQLCQAVGRIHQTGYAHLDIAPASITLFDGSARLLMLGRVRRLGTSGAEYLTTDGYSAPELYGRAQVPVEGRADIYSIGAVLYTLLTGKVLSLGGGGSEVLVNIHEFQLARILLSCLATNPDSRYGSADKLGQALLDFQSRPRLTLRFDTAILSDVGMLRHNNEDCGMVLDLGVWAESRTESYGLYVVADGMGGERAGEVASARAIKTIARVIWSSLSDGVAADFNELVRVAIETANNEIYLSARDDPALSSMGTTVTLGLRIGEALYVGHVGDSRAYLLREGTLTRLTEDHSLVAGLLKAGIITSEQAKTHPERGKIFRSLGNAPTVVVDSLKERLMLHAGDTLILCSDGLVDHVTDDELLAVGTQAGTAHGACSQLIALANRMGGYDNITLIVVKANSTTA